MLTCGKDSSQELYPLRASNNTHAVLEREIAKPGNIVNLRVVFK